MKKKITVLGAGTWGAALAQMLSLDGHKVCIWTPFQDEAERLNRTRCQIHLPDMLLSNSIVVTSDLQIACQNPDILLFAVPSPFVRETAAKIRSYIHDEQLIVDVGKGMEAGTLMTLTQVISDELNKDGLHGHVRLVALSGPTHAEEVARNMPSSIVAASRDTIAARTIQEVFTSTCMRVYTNPDILGVELCGAMKNIVALAAGIAAGLGYGDNTRAALITRGLAEIIRLGRSMGCRDDTFAGLAGVGDLIVTATSQHSRNNRCGQLIGMGKTPEQAIQEVGMVVEGINALQAAMELKERYAVDMPIVDAVDSVVHHGVLPSEAVYQLMNRDKKDEFY